MRYLITLLAVFSIACSAPVEVALPRAQAVVVASDLDNAPFAYVDERGTPAGRDVEMMRRLAERAGIELDWKRMPFDQLMPALEVGSVDLVCATLGRTEERAQRMSFTRPYFRTAIAVVVRTEPDAPRSLADLAGRPISAGRGTTSEQAARRRLPAARISHADEAQKDATTESRLLDGEIDAAVMDGPAADALVKRSGGRLARLDTNLDEELYALALPLDRVVLTRRLDEALRDMEAAGELAALDLEFGLR